MQIYFPRVLKRVQRRNILVPSIMSRKLRRISLRHRSKKIEKTLVALTDIEKRETVVTLRRIKHREAPLTSMEGADSIDVFKDNRIARVRVGADMMNAEDEEEPLQSPTTVSGSVTEPRSSTPTYSSTG